MNPLLSALSAFGFPHIGRHCRTFNRLARCRTARRAVLGVEALEERSLLSTLSIGDASAVEGASSLKFLDHFVPPGSGGLSRANGSIFGADGNLYVADGDTNSILRYDGVTGAFTGVFVSSGSGDLQSPFAPTFGPDGSLYVSSFATGQVLRYDGSSGAFLDTVVSGLSLPIGLTFGPDGSLYIANRGTNEVLRYNTSGLSTFIPAGSGGLSQPRKVVFSPDGNMYVASQGTMQVLRYNGVTGAFIDVFATMPAIEAGTGPMWLEFGTDGYLYVTARDSSTSLNVSILRFNAANGTFVDHLPLGRDGWSFDLGSGNIVYDSNDEPGGFVDRFGATSLAAFTVSLDYAIPTPVTVDYATADGTALAGTDYLAASGTLTFAPGVTTQTILIQTLDDGVIDPPKTFAINLSNPVGADIARGEATGTILDGDSTKFFVVDAAGPASTYRYSISGSAFGNSTLDSGDTAPRGVASDPAGTGVWVVDANQTVYVYDPSGVLLGSWFAGGLPANANVAGITTDGTDIWLLENSSHSVYHYAGAAGLLSGSVNADASFPLAGDNPNAKGLVTDGHSFWVVDGSALEVFKYTLSGSSLGNWAIDPADAHPTGITINPSNVSDIWIVDNVTLQVYQYVAAADRISGSQNADATFALNPYDTNPQGIADPPPADMLVTRATVASSDRPSLNAVVSSRALTDALIAATIEQDTSWAILRAELEQWRDVSMLNLLAGGTNAVQSNDRTISVGPTVTAGRDSGQSNTSDWHTLFAPVGSDGTSDDSSPMVNAVPSQFPSSLH
jgi:streptogramin lyase